MDKFSGGMATGQRTTNHPEARGTFDYIDLIRGKANAIRLVAGEVGDMVRGNAPTSDSCAPKAPGINGELSDILDLLTEIERDLTVTRSCMYRHTPPEQMTEAEIKRLFEQSHLQR